MKIIPWKDGLWYFAHPYTSRLWNRLGMVDVLGQEANYRLCCIRSAELCLRGWRIFSPICHSHPIHTAHAEMTAEGYPWYAFDNYLIDVVPFKGIILAPEYKESVGCMEELKRFQSSGRTTLHYDDLV
jgi:hypothetical protein